MATRTGLLTLFRSNVLRISPAVAQPLSIGVRAIGVGAQTISELIGSILWAVPKKKTSHSKKRMRASNKALKNITNIMRCHSCGRPKLMHHICKYCYKDIRKKLLGISGDGPTLA
ncbi:hypothetical protein K7432_002621 [Basidiobolus ranarum]|uniref:Large ribosomal subunit protein bL32m n=1 Tax=Basidiobolus ranarum TaxID=34480 RepID=A0ABR2X1A3_9FUNG